MNIIEILEAAIESEINSKEKYLKLAKEATDPETRAALEQLARDEGNHAQILRDRLTAIRLMQDLGGV
ncbi:rubrerythrin [archaeon BMS3Abin16]|nr:rubrerythrin [archaeon BMS3Abin16]HDY74730.1 rubrerythrin [Euryarchaeota archaeon]